MVKYGLIGKSLDHSWSKDYFLDKFLREGISNCAYENYALGRFELLPQSLLLKISDIAGLKHYDPIQAGNYKVC